MDLFTSRLAGRAMRYTLTFGAFIREQGYLTVVYLLTVFRREALTSAAFFNLPSFILDTPTLISLSSCSGHSAAETSSTMMASANQN